MLAFGLNPLSTHTHTHSILAAVAKERSFLLSTSYQETVFKFIECQNLLLKYNQNVKITR